MHSQKIGNPESIEKVASANFLLSVILPQVKECKDVCVPWLEVDGEGARALVATLIDVTSSRIVGPEHGHDPV